MDFKGTKSEENIKAAFAGEAQARSRYTYFAEQAKKEGNDEIAELFEKMARNELTHARIWYKLMHNGIGDSASNILEAAAGESYEWQTMYPDFARQAREDGLEDLAILFEKVADIENQHEKMFLQALVNLSKKDAEVEKKIESLPVEPVKQPNYRCMFCGAVSDTYLDVCPVCEAIGAYERVNA